MSGGQRYCQALDLADDPELQQQYRELHQQIWPEISHHLRRYGVTQMEIYLLGNRLVMIMETAPDFDAAQFAAQSEQDAKVREWEALMWRYQRPTPWTPSGEKWVAMERIFSLQSQI